MAGLSCGRLGTVRLKFHGQFPPGEPLDTEIFEWERRLTAVKGIGY